jgi:hypothetical protein
MYDIQELASPEEWKLSRLAGSCSRNQAKKLPGANIRSPGIADDLDVVWVGSVLTPGASIALL